MNTICPQRAKSTHRAEGASLLPTGKNIVSSLLQGYPSGRLPRYARNDIIKIPHKPLIYCDQITDDIYYKYTPSARFFKAKYNKNNRARSMKNR